MPLNATRRVRDGLHRDGPQRGRDRSAPRGTDIGYLRRPLPVTVVALASAHAPLVGSSIVICGALLKPFTQM